MSFTSKRQFMRYIARGKRRFKNRAPAFGEGTYMAHDRKVTERLVAAPAPE